MARGSAGLHRQVGLDQLFEDAARHRAQLVDREGRAMEIDQALAGGRPGRADSAAEERGIHLAAELGRRQQRGALI